MKAETIIEKLSESKAQQDNQICLNAYANGINDTIEVLKLTEVFELLHKASFTIQHLKLSMLVHPDHETGSEFDDMTSSAQKMEDSISELLKSISIL